MDVRQLRYFLGIVEHGSLSRAAEALRVAQPALSLHLKRLEEEFDCQLVVRTARGVVPTEAGQRLAQRAAGVMDSISALRDEVRGVEANPTGNASIGIPTSFGPAMTVPLARTIHRDHPGIRLRVVEGLSGHMLEWVRSGQVDLAVVFEVDDIPGLATEFIGREALRLVAQREDPLVQARETVSLGETLSLPLILPGRPHGLREEVERAGLRIGQRPSVIMEIDALDQIKALVAEGIGYTIVSERVAKSGPTAPALVSIPIQAPGIVRRLHLAHGSDRPLSLAARTVRNIARELILSLARGV